MAVTSLIEEEICLVEGDSSNIYTFSSTDFPDISAGDWSSLMNVRVGSIEGTVSLTRALVKDTSTAGTAEDPHKFVFQLTPTETDALGVDRFYVTIGIFNLAIDFRREVVQTPLRVLESGNI